MNTLITPNPDTPDTQTKHRLLTEAARRRNRLEPDFEHELSGPPERRVEVLDIPDVRPSGWSALHD
jgi:hypothetical protein